ncbi:MAG: hypothetical protein ACKVP3_24930 [Hyphomicrobiaceae bacterium]
MMKLDPTLKHLGVALRRRLSDVPIADAPHRISELMERLSRVGQSQPTDDAPSSEAVSSPK